MKAAALLALEYVLLFASLVAFVLAGLGALLNLSQRRTRQRREATLRKYNLSPFRGTKASK